VVRLVGPGVPPGGFPPSGPGILPGEPPPEAPPPEEPEAPETLQTDAEKPKPVWPWLLGGLAALLLLRKR